MKFDINNININLAELKGRTGISRSWFCKLKKDGFIVKPHGRTSKKSNNTVPAGYAGVLDDLLGSNVSNVSECYEQLLELGYKGKLTQIRVYLEQHLKLLPQKRFMGSHQ